jgi:hypothetical protein
MWRVYRKTIAQSFAARLREGDARKLVALLKPLI